MIPRMRPADVAQFLNDYGYTNKEIAAEIGVHQTTVSRITRGMQTPRHDVIDKLLALAEREAAKVEAMRKRLIAMSAEAV